MAISENFEIFQEFNFKINFLENEKSFQNRPENALFPYKNVMPEAKVKTNSNVSTKWTYHKEQIFASN